MPVKFDATILNKAFFCNRLCTQNLSFPISCHNHVGAPVAVLSASHSRRNTRTWKHELRGEVPPACPELTGEKLRARNRGTLLQLYRGC
eukprot:1086938-Amphidinium_carterae.2